MVAILLASSAPHRRSAGGDGYELNFDNAPVTTVAKVILGDILGSGYTIDPRVQGTVSLASGQPVQKADLLFVLESALRLSNVAMVKDTTGYRLLPLSEAVGSGRVDGPGTPPPTGIRHHRRAAALRQCANGHQAV